MDNKFFQVLGLGVIIVFGILVFFKFLTDDFPVLQERIVVTNPFNTNVPNV